jgi:hypothetical protein
MENNDFIWPWSREYKRQQHSLRAKKAWITRRRMAEMQGQKRPTGRPKLYKEMTIARLPEGSLARIERALKYGETQGAFVRMAIAKELQAREADEITG